MGKFVRKRNKSRQEKSRLLTEMGRLRWRGGEKRENSYFSPISPRRPPGGPQGTPWNDLICTNPVSTSTYTLHTLRVRRVGV